MSFEKMNSAKPPSGDEIIELELDQKVDGLLRSTEVTPAAVEVVPTAHTEIPEGDAITFFPKSPQQDPFVPELVPSGGSEVIHSHGIRAEELRKMMINWQKQKKHHENFVRNEKQPNTIYVRITEDQGLQWYTLQNEADKVRLVLSYSDDPNSDSYEKSFSGSDAEKHFEEFCDRSKLIYVDINENPAKISPEIRAEIGRKLQELINKRAVLDSLLRQEAQKTRESLLDTVARWFGRERAASPKGQKSMEDSSGIAEAREEVDIARRELAEQCRQINEQQSERSVIIPSRTKSFVVDSSQNPSSSPDVLFEEQEKKVVSEDQKSALVALLAEVATTQEELSLLGEKKNSLLKDLDFPEAMKKRFQKLREEAEGYFSGIDSLTLSDFFTKLVFARIQNRTPKNRKQSIPVDQESGEVFI